MADRSASFASAWPPPLRSGYRSSSKPEAGRGSGARQGRDLSGKVWQTLSMNWRVRIEPLTRPLFFAVSRAQRGMTLGVRSVAVDANGRVMLVKHTYLQVWFNGFRKFRDGKCPLPASAPLAASTHSGHYRPQTFLVVSSARIRSFSSKRRWKPSGATARRQTRSAGDSKD